LQLAVAFEFCACASAAREHDRHLPDTNYFLYSLQLNVYRYMLESEYGYRCSSMWLAVVHPDNDQPRLISCPRMDAEIAAIVDYELECGRAKAAAVPGNDARFVV